MEATQKHSDAVAPRAVIDTSIVDDGQLLRETWEAAELEMRRSLLRLAIDRVTARKAPYPRRISLPPGSAPRPVNGPAGAPRAHCAGVRRPRKPARAHRLTCYSGSGAVVAGVPAADDSWGLGAFFRSPRKADTASRHAIRAAVPQTTYPSE
ncbi:hypothetical protein Spla01_00245 [Streptomyces platensis]|uniref:Uncharacterized protein n=1 Tax=Streptomyces platensis TaxID=58346 RepID=A0ABX3Y5B6_STRPT|nr:hypothetical protein BG653_00080 [Streptomyces platensis]